MKTLQLRSGDLVVGPKGHATIDGSLKIRQELALSLGERYGTDRFHPTWGSVLPNYIGAPITEELRALVNSEVARVIQAYIDTQRVEILDNTLTGTRSPFSTADVVTAVTSIDAEVGLDTIRISVGLLTAASQNLTITRTVSL